MAKLSDLIPAAAKVMGIPEKTVALYARALREARLISTGGRGPGGASMTPGDCTNLLLAILGSEHVKDAVLATRLSGNLVLNELVSIAPAQENSTPGWKALPPPLRFMNNPAADLPGMLFQLIDRAREGRLQEGFAKLQNPTLRIEVSSPVPHAAVTLSDIVDGEPVSMFFADYLSNPTTSAELTALVEHYHRNADFRTTHEVSHKTIIALGELLNN